MSVWNKDVSYPDQHFLITPSDTALLPIGMVVYCNDDGTIAVEDKNGTAITYAVNAGFVLPVVVTKVLATGTTVTSIVGLM